MQGDARDAGVIKARISPAFGARTYPFDQIEVDRMGIVAQLEQAAAGARTGNAQRFFQGAAAAFGDVGDLLEADVAVELQRALEVAAVDRQAVDGVSQPPAGGGVILALRLDRRGNSQQAGPPFSYWCRQLHYPISATAMIAWPLRPRPRDSRPGRVRRGISARQRWLQVFELRFLY